MKLCEIIRTPETTDATYNATVEYIQKIGKSPVVCGDTPGFIVNRLLVPFLAQVCRNIFTAPAHPRG